MKFGIIGGTGLEDTQILKDVSVTEVLTKYGSPSSSLKCGSIDGVDVVIISRHGDRHQITPTHVNNRANILALKEAGVTHIFATSAAGSLREEIGMGDIVIPDQFIDFTKFREVTVYEDFNSGICHTPMADPFDLKLRSSLIEAAKQQSLTFHSKGTVITIEGPRFSSKAESRMFRLWGADVINMSIAPEVIIANEMNIPYACVVISTDYDCWRDDVAHVSFESVLKVFEQNVEKVKRLLIKSIVQFSDQTQ
ncbi:MAG: S-methyl-5'-thioadenosine phosphorylase [Bacteroidia bacterium]|nr:S-methyl-5'-thioadenosine phosphorylase [Bacteroidia bacterium]